MASTIQQTAPSVADILAKNNAPAPAANSSGGTDASADLNNQYNDFLLLLTKQLQNQDPMSPLDTAQFTQQLVGFSSVEQMIQQNKRLDQLIGLQSSSNTYAAASFLGNKVAVDSNDVALKDGKASFQYSIEHSAVKAQLRITDANGQVVLIQQANEGVGTYQVDWEGQNIFGNKLPDGKYTVSVAYEDEKGNTYSSPITAFGTVDSADIKDGQVSLNVGSVTYPIDKIIKIVHETPADDKPVDDKPEAEDPPKVAA